MTTIREAIALIDASIEATRIASPSHKESSMTDRELARNLAAHFNRSNPVLTGYSVKRAKADDNFVYLEFMDGSTYTLQVTKKEQSNG